MSRTGAVEARAVASDEGQLDLVIVIFNEILRTAVADRETQFEETAVWTPAVLPSFPCERST